MLAERLLTLRRLFTHTTAFCTPCWDYAGGSALPPGGYLDLIDLILLPYLPLRTGPRAGCARRRGSRFWTTFTHGLHGPTFTALVSLRIWRAHAWVLAADSRVGNRTRLVPLVPLPAPYHTWFGLHRISGTSTAVTTRFHTPVRNRLWCRITAATRDRRSCCLWFMPRDAGYGTFTAAAPFQDLALTAGSPPAGSMDALRCGGSSCRYG